MRERGLDVDHSTVFRWVQRYAPEIRYERRSQKQTSSVPPKFLLNFGGLSVGHCAAQGQAAARIAGSMCCHLSGAPSELEPSVATLASRFRYPRLTSKGVYGSIGLSR
jgi:hypothetical protein